MAITQITSRSAIEQAMREFDRLGRDEFLATHGYRPARTYHLAGPEGRLYDSKAILGVAHGYQFPAVGPLRADQFSGGETTVKKHLESLGFNVVRDTETDESVTPDQSSPARNPPWGRDELILAFDTYIACGGNPASHAAREVVELSSQLNQLHKMLGTTGSGTLRNANGVYMKLMNFRRFDPAFSDSGRAGLSRGNRIEEEVYTTFQHDQNRLRGVAQAIRDQIRTGEHSPQLNKAVSDFLYKMSDFMEAPEGRLLTVTHLQRERNRKLVLEKKAQVFEATNKLCCEACGLDLADQYGERGRGVIECHHNKPLESLIATAVTKLSDLSLVCPNCHRIIHGRRPWLTMHDVKKLLQRY